VTGRIWLLLNLDKPSLGAILGPKQATKLDNMNKTRARSVAARPKPPVVSAGVWSIVTFDDLDAWRLDHSLTQASFCRLAGISTGAYYSWRKGIYAPSDSVQRRLKKLIAKKAPAPATKAKPKTKTKAGLSRAKVEEAAKQFLAKGLEESANSNGADVVKPEIEIAAINAVADIIKTYLSNSDQIKPDALVSLAGNLQQALLGDF
jgi:transcriptional regulator with XRE-family HTH domain